MIVPISRTDQFLRLLCSHHDAPLETAKPAARGNERHPFTITADTISSRIAEVQSYLQTHQTRYLDFSARGMSDTSRDEIDSMVAQFLREAMSQLDTLKQDAVLQLRDRSGGSFPAHKLGVVSILNGELQAVSRICERLRGGRIEQALKERQQKCVQYDAEEARRFAAERHSRDKSMGVDDGVEEFESMQQQFAMENASLVTELVETREQVKQAERTLFEIANLNHIFATKVLEQAREIEVLYELAVEATVYVERGNRELRKMKDRGPVLKYGLAGLAVLLAFALVFLEWMGRRRSLFFA